MTQDTGHIAYGNNFLKISGPCSYGFGMIEIRHLRGISVDNRQYVSIALGNTWHKSGERVQKKKLREFLSALGGRASQVVHTF